VSCIVHGDLWIVQSGDAAFVLGQDADGVLIQVHWGCALAPEDYPHPNDLRRFRNGYSRNFSPQPVQTSEGVGSHETTLDWIGAAGSVRGAVLRVQSASVDSGGLVVTLIDQPLSVEVVYRVAAASTPGLFVLGMEIRNRGEAQIKLVQATTATLSPPRHRSYAVTCLSGEFSDEFKRQRQQIPFGVLQRQGRELRPGFGGPAFAMLDDMDPGNAASETWGEVWFAALRWSGNWKMRAERRDTGETFLHLGLNDQDFAVDLRAGESFNLPEVVFGYSVTGFSGGSQKLHDFVRDEIAPTKQYIPPVVFNSWFATLFEVTEQGQMALAEQAAALGIEMFIMDDGWFGERNSDRAGLGDWQPNPAKFPRGLTPLADRVHELGMQFGLWVEPEMTNPDSDLFRKHPEWIIQMPGRDRTEWRFQYMLNLARPDVQDHLIETFDHLISSVPLDLVKWDVNRGASEPGWAGYERDEREIWTRYVEGLTRVWAELRRRHAHVLWENSASGGSRCDFGTVALAEQTAVTDNFNPPARLQIQEGFGLAFPPHTMAGWVSDGAIEGTSLEFAFHVNMAGALAVGGDLTHWDEAHMDGASKLIAEYKAIRPVLATGDHFRISNSQENPWCAFAHVAKDKSEAVLFTFRTHHPRKTWAGKTFPVPGLEQDARYRLEGSDLVRTGRGWGTLGVAVELADFESRILRLCRLD
jgi:alpha-galactosidase